MDRLRSFGFLLAETSRRYVARFEQRAREIALTLPQCKTLTRLERNEGVSQARLAELAGVDPMTMVRILDRMESDGLLERRADPTDRRARCLYLTDKARPLLEQIWRLAERTRAESLAGISVEEREAFVGVLERVHANVCALEGQPLPASESTAATAIAPRRASMAPSSRKTRAR